MTDNKYNDLVEEINFKTPSPQPVMVLVYGQPGLGKTSFACEFPNVVFIGTENGIPRDANVSNILSFKKIRNLEGFYKACFDIENGIKEGSLNCQTIVIDHLGGLEKFIIQDLENQTGHSFGSAAYGQDFNLLNIYVTNPEKAIRNNIKFNIGIASKLRMFYEKYNISIVLIAHSVVKRVELPGELPYDRYEPDLKKQILDPIAKDCTDILFFDTNKVITTERSGLRQERNITVENKSHPIIIRSGAGSVSYLAKSRNSMPYELHYTKGNGAALLLKNAGIQPHTTPSVQEQKGK